MSKRVSPKQYGTYAEHEAWVIEGAEKFVACVFAGRGEYDKREGATLAEGEATARAIIAERPAGDKLSQGRPVLVYAIRGVHSVVAATVYPERKE